MEMPEADENRVAATGGSQGSSLTIESVYKLECV